jgi:hypothetical protein
MARPAGTNKTFDYIPAVRMDRYTNRILALLLLAWITLPQISYIKKNIVFWDRVPSARVVYYPIPCSDSGIFSGRLDSGIWVLFLVVV